MRDDVDDGEYFDKKQRPGLIPDEEKGFTLGVELVKQDYIEKVGRAAGQEFGQVRSQIEEEEGVSFFFIVELIQQADQDSGYKFESQAGYQKWF